ncbi:hypothetical protein NP681_004215 [Salmonella enterica]|nr:hypothetical protein [Salmonella enterica]EJR3519435.1 hypothetical protein [Salmonella enterica]
MKNEVIEWKINEDQRLGDVILNGYPESFDKAHGYYFHAIGDVTLNMEKNPATECQDCCWSDPSDKYSFHSNFLVSYNKTFMVSGSGEAKIISVTDAKRNNTDSGVFFTLQPEASIVFKNLDRVLLSNSKCESQEHIVQGTRPLLISAEANEVQLFNRLVIKGSIKISVESFVFSTGYISSVNPGQWFLEGNSSLNYNEVLKDTVPSMLSPMSELILKENAHANIYAETVKIWPRQNKTFIMSGNSSIDIHTKVFEIESINMQHPNIAFSISEQANVTIHPFNECLPVDALKEVNLPEEERTLWAGMFNFESGATGSLKLMGVGNAFQFSAMNALNLIYLNGEPVDMLRTFKSSYSGGDMLITLNK